MTLWGLVLGTLRWLGGILGDDGDVVGWEQEWNCCLNLVKDVIDEADGVETGFIRGITWTPT